LERGGRVQAGAAAERSEGTEAMNARRFAPRKDLLIRNQQVVRSIRIAGSKF
jgi:hypothetical protein